MDSNKTRLVSSLETQSTKQLQFRNSDLSQTSSQCTTTTADGDTIRKIPPNKAKVGLAKSPDLKNCKSKVGSLNNIQHKPSGGRVAIQTQKLNWSAESKVGSLDNKEHKPSGGNVKVESRKLQWKTSSKVESLSNIDHKPGGGNVKIFNESYRDKSVLTSFSKNLDCPDETGRDSNKTTCIATITNNKTKTKNNKPQATALVARGTKPRGATPHGLTRQMRNLNLTNE